jgi:hypothetical protein
MRRRGWLGLVGQGGHGNLSTIGRIGLRPGKLGRSSAAPAHEIDRAVVTVRLGGLHRGSNVEGYTPYVFWRSGEVVGNQWVTSLWEIGVNKTFGMNDLWRLRFEAE